MQFHINTNPSLHWKKYNYTLEKIQFNFEKKSDCTLEQIQFHIKKFRILGDFWILGESWMMVEFWIIGDFWIMGDFWMMGDFWILCDFCGFNMSMTRGAAAGDGQARFLIGLCLS